MNGSTLTLSLVGALALGAAVGRRGSRGETRARTLSIQGHAVPLDRLQYIIENEGFTADDAYYDDMARILNGLVFPLRVYRGLAVPPGKAIREDDLHAGKKWWTWNRDVAVHFARGTHSGSESTGEAWLASGIILSPADVDWWNDKGDHSSIEQYLRFSSPYVDASQTDDSLLVRAIANVSIQRLS